MTYTKPDLSRNAIASPRGDAAEEWIFDPTLSTRIRRVGCDTEEVTDDVDGEITFVSKIIGGAEFVDTVDVTTMYCRCAEYGTKFALVMPSNSSSGSLFRDDFITNRGFLGFTTDITMNLHWAAVEHVKNASSDENFRYDNVSQYGINTDISRELESMCWRWGPAPKPPWSASRRLGDCEALVYVELALFDSFS